MLNRIRTEPALVAGLIQTALALAVAFGLDLTDVQIAAILGFSAAALALVVRAKVTPVAAEDELELDEAGEAPHSLLLGVLIGVVGLWLVLELLGWI